MRFVENAAARVATEAIAKTIAAGNNLHRSDAAMSAAVIAINVIRLLSTV